MNTSKKSLFAASIILFFTSCASIVSHTNWPFSVDSSPAGAKVTITNKKGMEIFSGRTPTALKLKSGAGYFSKESYTVTLSMDGYDTRKINVECKVNGWYFGNILIGGLIGLLIVDPATGAMFKLDNEGIFENLKKSAETTSILKSNETSASLKIVDKNQIPESWERHLIKVN